MALNTSIAEFHNARREAEMTSHWQLSSRTRWQPAPQPVLLTPEEQDALAFLVPLSRDYPDFEHWFKTKVVPGLRNGTRTIIRIERANVLVGVGIGKRDEIEKKICTVRIAQPYFGRGLGLRLFDTLLKWLSTDRPHLTVSERKLPAFERIFDFYGFQATSRELGRYVPNVIELGYNESAPKAGRCFSYTNR